MGHSPSMASGVESFQFETNNLFVSSNKEGFVAGNKGSQWLSRGLLKTTFLVLLPKCCGWEMGRARHVSYAYRCHYRII